MPQCHGNAPALAWFAARPQGMSGSMNKAHYIVRFDSLGGALTMVAILEHVDEGAPLEAAP
jgi:hypothetical protein